MNMQEFLKRNPSIELDAMPVDGNPHISDMPAGSRHFVCIIRGEHDSMTCHYSVGPGIVEQWLRDVKPPMTGGHYSRKAWLDNPRCIAAQDYVDWAFEKYRPELGDVLECLISDARTIENTRTFEEWCDELGLDSDSRKAYGIWEHCLKQRAQLQDALGNLAYLTLLEDVDE